MNLILSLKSDVKQERTNKSLLLAMKAVQNQDHSQPLLIDSQQRIQDAEDEIASLRKQLGILKGLCEKARNQQGSGHQRIDELLALVRDKDTRINALEESLEEERDASGALQLENDNLKHAYTESQQHGKQLERTAHFLRERGEEAQLEVKQLTEEFQSLNVRFQAIQEACAAAETAHKQAAQENDQLRTDLNSLNQQKQQFDTHLNNVQQANQDNERSLKLAQHHLAKKMKEVAVLSEKLEEQRHQIVELKHTVSEMHAKATSSQEHFALQLQHEQRLQEQLQEVLRNNELQVKRWEENYFQLYAKCQEAEAQNKSLRALEEKQHQIQALLASMGSIVNVLPEKQSAALKSDSNSVPSNEESVDKPVSPVRYKQTLFD